MIQSMQPCFFPTGQLPFLRGLLDDLELVDVTTVASSSSQVAVRAGTDALIGTHPTGLVYWCLLLGRRLDVFFGATTLAWSFNSSNAANLNTSVMSNMRLFVAAFKYSQCPSGLSIDQR
jgi:hypothetical protein